MPHRCLDLHHCVLAPVEATIAEMSTIIDEVKTILARRAAARPSNRAVARGLRLGLPAPVQGDPERRGRNAGSTDRRDGAGAPCARHPAGTPRVFTDPRRISIHQP